MIQQNLMDKPACDFRASALARSLKYVYKDYVKVILSSTLFIPNICQYERGPFYILANRFLSRTGSNHGLNN